MFPSLALRVPKRFSFWFFQKELPGFVVSVLLVARYAISSPGELPQHLPAAPIALSHCGLVPSHLAHPCLILRRASFLQSCSTQQPLSGFGPNTPIWRLASLLPPSNMTTDEQSLQQRFVTNRCDCFLAAPAQGRNGRVSRRPCCYSDRESAGNK